MKRVIRGLPARHYVDAEGRYLGAFAGALRPLRVQVGEEPVMEARGDADVEVGRRPIFDVRDQELPPNHPPGSAEVLSPPPSLGMVWDREKWVAVEGGSATIKE